MVDTARKPGAHELVKNIIDTKYEAFDPKDIEYAKNRVIDIVGCAIGGANASGNSAMLGLITEWGGKKEATILGHGIKAPVHNVAMMNSLMCRSYDYEVSGAHFEGKSFPGHQPSVTVPTALTVAEYKNASGKNLLTALILGDDALCRITAAADYNMDSPWDCTGTINKFGATAVAGRLFGLNEQQMVNAFGIVVDTVASSFQSLWDGVHTFKLHGALACRDGIFSVQLASKGFTGLKEPLLSDLGFLPVYSKSYLTELPDILTRDLGRKFYSGAGSGHKPYPCCHGNHVAIECAWEIVQKNKFDPQDIDEIALIVSPERLHNFLNQPYDIDVACQTKATFNLPYNIANVLTRKSLTRLEHFTDEAVRDTRVIEVAKKVKLVGSLPLEKATADLTAGLKMASGLRVKMKDGKEFSSFIEASRGRPGHELSKEEIRDKFWANVGFSKVIAKPKAEQALHMMENLEEVKEVAKIVRLLTA